MSDGTLVPIRADIAAFGKALKAKQPVLQQLAPQLNVERWMRIVYQSVVRTPKLMNCTADSVLRSALQAAELGLEPGGARGEAYLVPFGQECIVIVGYRGWVNLFYRSGAVKKVVARCVFEGDEYEECFGTDEYIRHRPCGETDPAKIIRAYAIVWLSSGDTIPYSVTREQIERHRARSRAGREGPWVTDYAAMCAKTALLGLKSWVPSDERIGKAMSAEIIADTGDLTTIGEFESTDAAPEGRAAETAVSGPIRLARKLKQGRSEHEAACARFFAIAGQLPDEKRHEFASDVFGKPVRSFRDLTPDEIDRLTSAWKEQTETQDEAMPLSSLDETTSS